MAGSQQADALEADAASLANDSKAAVEAMTRVIGDISTSSSQILSITALIDGIAFQTNILTLNAAMEVRRGASAPRLQRTR